MSKEEKIEILYEEDDFMILNKPSGIIIHPSEKRREGFFVTTWIIEKYPEIKKIGESIKFKSGEEILRPGIVHRLDKETSGVLVVAKTDRAFEYFKSLFKDRKIKKSYNAFVYGLVKKDKGIIDRPIGKSSKDFRLWSAQRGAKGKIREAVTNYQVLAKNNEVSFLEIYPLTGRTHQIRVHFKAINHPVVCDFLYAPKKESILGFKRIALHAVSVEFKNLKGKNLLIKAPLPEDFVTAFNFLGKSFFDFDDNL
jgi:23S rRNA pseudouridine1911/1915/1917 synthase